MDHTKPKSRDKLIGLDPRRRLGSHSLSLGLPEDLQQQAVRRVIIVAAAWGGALLISVTFNALLHLLYRSVPLPPVTIAVRIGGAVVAAATVVLLRYSRLSLAAKCDIGLVFQIFGAASLATFELSMLPEVGIPVGHLSSATMWIVVFGLLIPNPTVKALLGGLLSAAAVPLAVWVQRRLGAELPWPSGMYIGTGFGAAVLAAVLSRQIYHIGRAVSEARRLGSYQLEKLLGSGGMGEVWRASHGMLKRPAAIKLIQPDKLGAPDPETREAALRRFELEAQATAELGSTHTVTIYDFGNTQDGAFYYVMELLDGLDLDTLVERHGAQPPERVASFLKQICHSLMDAHGRGLIHRDIKPANIFACRLGPDVDFIKVLDFGLVKHIDPEDGETTKLTREGVVTGTPAFMPPELALGTTPADERSDLYMLGCVGYYLLSGKQVFDGETAVALISHHIHSEPVPIAERAEHDVPALLAELIMSCLEKERDKRPESAAALWQRLDEAGLDRPWTRQRAGRWWDEHEPAASLQQPPGGTA